jgi:hypothetical protein
VTPAELEAIRQQAEELESRTFECGFGDHHKCNGTMYVAELDVTWPCWCPCHKGRPAPAPDVVVRVKGEPEPICPMCWAEEHPDREPYRLLGAELEECSVCGMATDDGIYV